MSTRLVASCTRWTLVHKQWIDDLSRSLLILLSRHCKYWFFRPLDQLRGTSAWWNRAVGSPRRSNDVERTNFVVWRRTWLSQDWTGAIDWSRAMAISVDRTLTTKWPSYNGSDVQSVVYAMTGRNANRSNVEPTDNSDHECLVSVWLNTVNTARRRFSKHGWLKILAKINRYAEADRRVTLPEALKHSWRSNMSRASSAYLAVSETFYDRRWRNRFIKETSTSEWQRYLKLGDMQKSSDTSRRKPPVRWYLLVCYSHFCTYLLASMRWVGSRRDIYKFILDKGKSSVDSFHE